MELKDLQIFLSVAEHGNISKGAKGLSFVQSYVTARVKALENELDTRLFLRHSRGVTLTAEGYKLQYYAFKITSLVNDIDRAFHNTDSPTGSLKVGTVETIVKLPEILSSFRLSYPAVGLSLETDVTGNMAAYILDGQLDGAFVTDFTPHTNIDKIELFKEKLVLMSRDKEMTAPGLRNATMLVFKEGCSYRANLEKWLYDEGVEEPKVMEFGTLETILGSVRSGLGISLVPRSTVTHLIDSGDIYAYDILDDYSMISTDFIWHRDTYLTHSMDKFIRKIQEFKSDSAVL